MTDTIHPILAECCARENSRYAMAALFRFGPHVCATDGRVAVRQMTDAEVPPVIADFPPIGDLGWDRTRASIGLAPEPPAPVLTPCKECGGKGKIEKRKCEECDGTGEVECGECGRDHDCEECDGKGTICAHNARCEDCHGTGSIDESPAVPFADGRVHISRHYAVILHRHGAELFVQEGDISSKPVYFKIGGTIDGLLMPVSVPAGAKR